MSIYGWTDQQGAHEREAGPRTSFHPSIHMHTCTAKGGGGGGGVPPSPPGMDPQGALPPFGHPLPPVLGPDGELLNPYGGGELTRDGWVWTLWVGRIERWLTPPCRSFPCHPPPRRLLNRNPIHVYTRLLLHPSMHTRRLPPHAPAPHDAPPARDGGAPPGPRRRQPAAVRHTIHVHVKRACLWLHAVISTPNDPHRSKSTGSGGGAAGEGYLPSGVEVPPAGGGGSGKRVPTLGQMATQVTF